LFARFFSAATIAPPAGAKLEESKRHVEAFAVQAVLITCKTSVRTM
jgi:hypothetical protein